MLDKNVLPASIATNRFGLGARPGDIEAAAKDPQGWVLAQLQTPEFSPGLPDLEAAWKLLVQDRQQRMAARQNRAVIKAPVTASMAAAPKSAATPASTTTSASTPTTTSMPPAIKAAAPAAGEDPLKSLHFELLQDGLVRSIAAEHSFSWRLLDFFSNHFSVSANGKVLQVLAPLLERDAIAPNLLGSFEEMLLAVSRHPAMLLYLNNERSFGPDSRLGRNRKLGLNENLGREILELHSLGVEGGYTQADVRELAMALSGWSVARLNGQEKPGFVFRAGGHQPGARLLLGKRYPEAGEAQAEHMLRDLARHPATARHVSFKLGQYVVSDSPPVELVDAMTARWLATGGDLREVVTVLVRSQSAWQQPQQKFKTPREFVVSFCRACKFRHLPPRLLLNSLTGMGQRPFAAGSPAGFSALASGWDGADALLDRVDWVARLAGRIIGEPVALGVTALGPQLTPPTRRAVMRAESREQAMVLLFMSPEFLRR
ncbi:DUF1800 domain-containing protein [Pseudomaricurvus alcaniphilus]|uniref:DUF1800 domain-containing protein n=1 Tax=Pseudomaricurvus alcaniphilus TaxID=1166482 RepID=UPI00140C94A8|nr:DUF1800 domain-containing protein [Pseudomaricurvus alcaniphilus]NHN37145.1 DUF1800 domain-containing protein [Pseudomaricurvus alcaniphilus]